MICTKIPAKILTLCRSFCLTSKSPVGCGHLDVNTIRFNCPEVQTIIGDSFTIKEDFISPLEEDNLVKEVEPVLKRYKYDDTHIDNVSLLHFILFYFLIVIFFFSFSFAGH